MPIAVVTDSTCDLSAAELERLQVRRVPLYVHFRGETYQDWIEITPADLVKGIQEGADPPTTSQPTPEDFGVAYREAAEAGADAIVVVTIASNLSGTYQSATLAAKDAPVPVTVVDSQNASLGAGMMVRRAASMRDAGADADAIREALEHMRDRMLLTFTVGTLEFLQKGGRIGRASAMVGSLLNIKPLLTLHEGTVAPAGKARGAKKAMKEMVGRLASYREAHPEGVLRVSFLHIQDEAAADRVRQAVREAGIDFEDAGTDELGAVVGVHVGPGTHGFYAFADDRPDLGI